MTTKTKRRPRFSFREVHIPKGAKLRSVFDTSVLATVVDDTHIRCKGEVTTLTAVAKKLARRHGRKWPSIQGPMYWTYNKTKLTELRH